MSEGPNYPMFRMAVDQVVTLYCKTCGFAKRPTAAATDVVLCWDTV